MWKNTSAPTLVFFWRVQISVLALSLKFSLAPTALATIFFVFDSSVLETHKNFRSRLRRSQHDNFYLFFKVNLFAQRKASADGGRRGGFRRGLESDSFFHRLRSRHFAWLPCVIIGIKSQNFLAPPAETSKKNNILQRAHKTHAIFPRSVLVISANREFCTLKNASFFPFCHE